MFNNLMKTLGLDVPASVIETVGKVVETIGELTDSEMIQSAGKFISENSDVIDS